MTVWTLLLTVGTAACLASLASASVCNGTPSQLSCVLDIFSNNCPSGTVQTASAGCDCLFGLCTGTKLTCASQSCCPGYTGTVASGCVTPVCSSCVNGVCSSPNVCTCSNGWTGSSCSTCIPANGCSTTNGYCVNPFECRCQSGWTGSSCTVPVCLAGCKFGSCPTVPNTCVCSTGYTGMLCDTPVCAACIQGSCTSPNVCTCTAGWTGSDCSTALINPGCVNGTSGGLPFGCVCNPGWTGSLCNTPVCNNPCQNGGACIAPSTCSCTSGWTDSVCATCIISQGCVNGFCNLPFQCLCKSGWMNYNGSATGNCDTPICASGCSATTGGCTVPGQCVCKTGWTGSNCDVAICATGCDPIHGSCTTPNTCDCEAGFTSSAPGICNAPICKTGCDQGNCTVPQQCNCFPGWTGTFCNTPICGSCVNGQCTAPGVCTCTDATKWSGPACDQPICTTGCLSMNCTQPGTCDCNSNYFGPQCNQPVCLKGCINGNCTKPGQCNCLSGWNGTFCDQPLCSSQCNLANAYCTVPNTCTCNSGWSGPSCSSAVCSAGCDPTNGFCTEPGLCSCKNPLAWTGGNCTVPICSSGCSPTNGYCTSPGLCQCDAGWTGSLCYAPICAAGCNPVNASCSTPGGCSCFSGWTGSTCNTAICLAGCANGTCDNNPGTCTCNPGWSGDLCDQAICANGCQQGSCPGAPGTCVCNPGWTNGPNPALLCDQAVCQIGCENGTCVNEPGACRCNPGFSGVNCSDIVNACASNNGGCSPYANCTSSLGSFVCTCNKGYTKNGDGTGADGCILVDQCVVNNGGCTPTLATCDDSQGTVVCTCIYGYVGSGMPSNDSSGCVAVDACTTNLAQYAANCSSNATCAQGTAAASFTCTCNTGYQGDGQQCTSIDYCATPGLCSPYSSTGCVDTPGSYNCGGSCLDGYIGNGYVCTPNGTINFLPGAINLQARVYDALSISVVAFSRGLSSIFYSVSGLDSSRFQIASPQPLKFNTTSNTAAISILLLAGASVYPATNFTVTLFNATGSARLGPLNVTNVQIAAFNNITGVVSFFGSEIPTIPEGSTTATFTLIRDALNASTLPETTVQYSTNDSTVVSGSATFAAGAAFANLTVTVTTSSQPTLGRNVLVSLLQTGGVTLGYSSTATVYIADTNFPHGVVTLSPPSTMVLVGNSGTVTINRNAGSFGDVSVNLLVVAGTASPDQYSFNPSTLTVSWLAGSSATQTFTFTVIDDGIPKLAEWFTITIDPASTTGGLSVSPSQNVTNVTVPANNQPYGVVGLTVSSVTIQAGSTTQPFVTVARSAGTFGSVVVAYSLAGPSAALAGFSTTSGLFSFMPGDKTAAIPLVYSSNVPLDIQFVTLTISNPTGGAVLDPTALSCTIEITDYTNLPYGTFGIQVDQETQFELSSPLAIGDTFTVTVVRTGATFGTVSLFFGPSADLDSRVSSNTTNFTMQFSPRQTSAAIQFTITDDGLPHDNSFVNLVLGLVSVNGGSVNGAALNGSASTLVVSIEPQHSARGIFDFSSTDTTTVTVGSTISLVVERSEGSQGAYYLAYSVSGTSLVISDSNNGSIIFPDGVTSSNITLKVVDGGFPALNQLFTVTLTTLTAVDSSNSPVDASGPFIGIDNQAEIAVPPSHNPYGIFGFAPASDLTVPETVGTFNLKVIRTAGQFGQVNVLFSVAGTAKQGIDYTINPPNGVLSFAAQQAQALIQVTIIHDPAPNAGSEFTLTITGTSPSIVPNGGNAIPIDISNATITIEPDGSAFGLFGLPALPYVSYSQASPLLYVQVTRTLGNIGSARVQFVTSSNDTAVPGVNFDLSLNSNVSASGTNGWVVFGDSVSTENIIVRFINIPHNTTTPFNPLSLGFSLIQCQVFDVASSLWVNSPGCSVDSTHNSVALEITDACSGVSCQNGGICIDNGQQAPFCRCDAGFKGDVCQTPIPPNSGGSTGTIAGTTWILPIIICVSVLILILATFYIVKRRRASKKLDQSKLPVTVGASSFVNPLYDSNAVTSKMSPVFDDSVHNDPAYADMPVSNMAQSGQTGGYSEPNLHTSAYSELPVPGVIFNDAYMEVGDEPEGQETKKAWDDEDA